MPAEHESQVPIERTDEHWLTIHEACALLGVDQTTLRRWSDAGRIPVFRTIGGHRRYAEADVRTLIEQHSAAGKSSRPSMPTPSGPAVSPSYLNEYIQAARDRQWFAAFDAASLEQLRGLGRDLVNLAMRYAGQESGSEERSAIIGEGQRIGVIYGQQAFSAGLTSAETVEAFLYFRFPVVFAAGSMVESPEISRERVTKVFSDINQFMDRVLLATVRAREDAAHRATNRS